MGKRPNFFFKYTTHFFSPSMTFQGIQGIFFFFLFIIISFLFRELALAILLWCICWGQILLVCLHLRISWRMFLVGVGFWVDSWVDSFFLSALIQYYATFSVLYGFSWEILCRSNCFFLIGISSLWLLSKFFVYMFQIFNYYFSCYGFLGVYSVWVLLSFLNL